MNSKSTYITLAIIFFVITVGMVVSNSYLFKQGQPELKVYRPDSTYETSGLTGSEPESGLQEGQVRQEGGRLIVNKSLPPQAERFVSDLEKITSELKQKTKGVKDNIGNKDGDIAQIIANAREKITFIDKEYKLGINDFIKQRKESKLIKNKELQDFEKKFDRAVAEAEEAIRELH